MDGTGLEPAGCVPGQSSTGVRQRDGGGMFYSMRSSVGWGAWEDTGCSHHAAGHSAIVVTGKAHPELK